mgnify:CR=1 FL=1
MGGFIDMQQLHDELLTHLIKTLTPTQMKQLEPHLAPLIQGAAQAVAEDLIAYAYRDPASRGRGELILESYASFKAVLYYRLAHRVWNFPDQPNGVFLPFLQHSRTTRMQRLQLSIDKPTTKRAWAIIVQSKIDNQARCMQLLAVSGADRLASYARRVRSGDTGNMEAQASAYYFPQVFGCGFHRSQEGWINAALDYGYAVMRGACARALVAHGLLPSVGLFHSSEQNAFNLADDLIEPYRAIVDLHVAQTYPADTDGELRPSDKVALVGLLNVDVAMPRGRMSVLSSIEQAAESLARLLDGGGEQALELPSLVGLDQHCFEM